MPKKERRKALRYARPFACDIVKVNGMAFARKWDDERGTEISTTGFQCCSTKNLPQMATIRAVFFFAEHADRLLAVEARLKWQKQRKDGWWDHGFRFLTMSPEDRRRLDASLLEGEK